MYRNEISGLAGRVERARKIDSNIETHERLLGKLDSILPQRAFTFSVEGQFRLVFPAGCGSTQERSSTALLTDFGGETTIMRLTVTEADAIRRSVVDAIRELVERSKVKLQGDLETV